MCVLLRLLICTTVRAHIIVVEVLYKHNKVNYYYYCNGVEWSKDRTQAAESIKWRPQQAYGSNQVLLSQPQTIFSTHKILMLTHR